MGKIFCVEFQISYPYIDYILYTDKDLSAPRIKSSYAFLKRSPDILY